MASGRQSVLPAQLTGLRPGIQLIFAGETAILAALIIPPGDLPNENLYEFSLTGRARPFTFQFNQRPNFTSAASRRARAASQGKRSVARYCREGQKGSARERPQGFRF